MLIADAHLDLAYNAMRGRDVVRPAEQQAPDNEGTPSVGLPDLRRGGVGLVCGTIFCEPASRNAAHGYRTADEAAAMARPQLDWYHCIEAEGHIRIVRKAGDVPTLPPPLTHVVLLMEGADPLRDAEDVRRWHEAGLRIVALAWKRTRLAGGTGDPGPLTAEGADLVRTLDTFGMIHDVSHLAEASFWQLLDTSAGPVIASHSNCRALIPTDRHLSDEMIRALVVRNAVIGINFYDRFLVPPTQYGQRRATLDDVIEHVRRICEIAGSARHVGLGTDMDGGFGQERIPVEIPTSGHLPRVAQKLADAGFNGEDVRRIMGGNWVEFFATRLPGAKS